MWVTEDGFNWTAEITSGSNDNVVFYSATTFGGYIYAGTYNTEIGGEIWRSLHPPDP